MEKIIVGLESYEDYLSKLSHKTKYPYYTLKERIFPNDEVLVRLEKTKEIRNREIILFFPTYPDTNTQLFKLFLGLSILQDYNCNNIILIIPYFSYSRQDKRFLNGEPISLKVLLNMLNLWPITKLITINIHNYDALKMYSKIDTINIDLMLELTKSALEKIGKEDTILIAPDEGRKHDVYRIAKSLGLSYAYCIKRRDRITGKVVIKDIIGIEKQFKSALIIDDEVSTGSTAIRTAKKLKLLGINDIYLAAVHLLLINKADEKLFNSGISEIYGTNTIRNKYSIVDVTGYLAEIIKKIGENE